MGPLYQLDKRHRIHGMIIKREGELGREIEGDYVSTALVEYNNFERCGGFGGEYTC